MGTQQCNSSGWWTACACSESGDEAGAAGSTPAGASQSSGFGEEDRGGEGGQAAATAGGGAPSSAGGTGGFSGSSGAPSSVGGTGGFSGSSSGAAGAGGSVAGSGGWTGGSSGSGASTSACDAKVVARGSFPLITDFEGVTEVFDYGIDPFNITSGQVLAGTYGYGDASVAPENLIFELVAGPDSDTALSLTLVDSSEWGGGFIIWIDGCIDARVYAGISFSIRGSTPDGTTRFYVQTGETRPEADGGSCPHVNEGDCVAPWTVLPLTDNWSEHRIAWADLEPGTSNDSPAPATGDNIVGLEWILVGDYDDIQTLVFAIDDLAFYAQ